MIRTLAGAARRLASPLAQARIAAVTGLTTLTLLAFAYSVLGSRATGHDVTPTSAGANAGVTSSESPEPSSPETPRSTPLPLQTTSVTTPITTPQTKPQAPVSDPGQVLVSEGYYFQRNGDYDTAAQRFRTVIGAYPGTPEAADAYLGLAETDNLNRQFRDVIETLQEFLQRFPADNRVNRVLFFLGNAYRATGDWGGAAYYYEHYVDRAETLRGYAYLNAGESYFQMGQFGKSIEDIQQALGTDLPRAARADAMARIGDSYFWLRGYASAVDWYGKALQLAQSADFKADLIDRAAKAYAAMGDVQRAEMAWAEVIENYPSTTYALDAVENLPTGSNPPTDYQPRLGRPMLVPVLAVQSSSPTDYDQGLVYYNNDRYDDAIASFNEYLARQPDGKDAPRAAYYLALSYRYQGDSDHAFAQFDRVAADYPKDNAAGDALWQSGTLSEALSRFSEAIAKYQRVADEYPNSQHAADARFRQGLCEFELGDLTAARSIWAPLATAPAPDLAIKAGFWLGKDLLEAGANDAGRARLEAAAGADSYYASRARTLLAGFPAYAGYQPGTISLGDSPNEKIEFERWLASWSGRPNYKYDGSNLTIAADPDFHRAEELIHVGSSDEAGEEIDDLRQKHRNDPVALYELAMFLRQNGMYYDAIDIATDIASLSPAHSLTGTPRFLQKLVYPVYYSDLLTAAGQRYGIDPLLLAAVIRQESMFDQNAESPAAAKGLAQIMPATARGIASDLGMHKFEQDDLFKPYVSIAFGAWYLWSQFASFKGNAFQALAAYNAGGSNVGKWLSGKTTDDDLFVEGIGFSETQAYVQRVYEQYSMYRSLYSTAGRSTPPEPAKP